MALDYLSIEIPLYMAVPEAAYENIFQHVLGQAMINRYAIPLLIFDPVREEIIQWMPEL